MIHVVVSIVQNTARMVITRVGGTHAVAIIGINIAQVQVGTMERK